MRYLNTLPPVQSEHCFIKLEPAIFPRTMLIKLCALLALLSVAFAAPQGDTEPSADTNPPSSEQQGTCRFYMHPLPPSFDMVVSSVLFQSRSWSLRNYKPRRRRGRLGSEGTLHQFPVSQGLFFLFGRLTKSIYIRGQATNPNE